MNQAQNKILITFLF